MDGGDLRNMTTELTSAERGAIFHEHFAVICRIDDQIALLNEEKKAAKRIAKNDGIASEDINWALRARKAETSEAVVDALRRRMEIAGWLNFIPPGTQLDMFEMPNDELQRAFAKGAVAASFNRTPKPETDGYDSSSAEGQNWLKGYHAENETKRENLKSAQAKLAERELQEAQAAPQPDAAVENGKVVSLDGAKKRGRKKKDA